MCIRDRVSTQSTGVRSSAWVCEPACIARMSAPTSPELHFQAAGAEKNGAIKRILREWKSMQKDQGMYGYQAKPSDDDIFEWHFMFHGAPGTDFSGGVYTGRINLPGEYPFKPPEIRLITPNGRFELNKKICLSISNYHPEHWQPSWDIRTIITALIAFMPSEGGGAIGSLDYPSEDRQKLAISSHQFVHPLFDTAEFLATVAVPETLPDIEVKAGTPAQQLSLIHISEPTRPY
eukprot:TRINITY_DN13002_c0_g1_i1.p1 TRINITY_DN13002_c0_g1~~TRINITY_DN13002_c0_g1_i1.p1  ORF type:complete len:234 (+),score=35.81 TRINITY_DN13002_c0_g1_i1:139-840(+)